MTSPTPPITAKEITDIRRRYGFQGLYALVGGVADRLLDAAERGMKADDVLHQVRGLAEKIRVAFQKTDPKRWTAGELIAVDIEALILAAAFAKDYTTKLSAAEARVRELEEALKTAAAGNGDPVRFYERDFYVLSNFSAFRLSWRGISFDTSEAAYHWEKFPGRPGLRNAIIAAPSAHEAFKVAEANKAFRRPDWDDVKVEIMREILTAKVTQHEYVRRKLLSTGTRQLVEDSWRDDFWGWGPAGDGQNMLGRLWMEVRSALGEKADVAQPHACCGVAIGHARDCPNNATNYEG